MNYILKNNIPRTVKNQKTTPERTTVITTGTAGRDSTAATTTGECSHTQHDEIRQRERERERKREREHTHRENTHTP